LITAIELLERLERLERLVADATFDQSLLIKKDNETLRIITWKAKVFDVIEIVYASDEKEEKPE
jgi:hypothetical protein